MNITAEQIARHETNLLYDPHHIRVQVNVSWDKGFCLPDPNGKYEETALFKVLSFGDNYAIEKAVTYEVSTNRYERGELVKVSVSDVNEYKRLLIKRNLVEWSLDIPIEKDIFGWLTPECYRRISNVPAPLLDAFVTKFENSIHVTEEEERKISRQCLALFAKNGHGVSDACEAVSMFCTLGNFSEKFGIDREKLANMPYREFVMLKIMIGKEGDSIKRNQNISSQVVGQGGRVTSSKGRRIALPGSN